jgi:hypothetical protein
MQAFVQATHITIAFGTSPAIQKTKIQFFIEYLQEGNRKASHKVADLSLSVLFCALQSQHA